MRIKFAYLFFWLVGIGGIYYPIKVALTDKSRILLVNFENPIISYAPVLFCISLSVVCLLIPVLIQLGIIASKGYYFGASKYDTAKTDFIIITLTIPGFAFLCISLLYAGVKVWLVIIFPLSILYRYISSACILLKESKPVLRKN